MHGGHGEVPRGGGRREERAEPLGEGAEVRAEERVRCVDGAVVRPEAAVRAGEPRQRRAARQSVQQVRPWPRHPAPLAADKLARSPPPADGGVARGGVCMFVWWEE